MVKHYRFLIAGGAGFIGSHIVKYLLSRKKVKKVVIIDNFTTGCIKNIENLINDNRLLIIEDNINNEKIIDEVNEKFDLVMHLAAIANPTDYEVNPLETLLVNSIGNLNLMNIVKKSKAQFIYFSSSEIYGDHIVLPYRGFEENSLSCLYLNKKRSPYSIGKCFGEELTINYCRKKGLKYLVIRPFNIYGSNMDLKTNYGRVIPNFIHWSLKKEQLRIHGDGLQERSFCYIDDFINGLFKLIEKDITDLTINIGNPEPISILKLANLINELQNKKSNYYFVDKYKFEPKFRTPNIDLIKKLTGWKPKISLENGLIKTIEWFKNGGIEKYERKTIKSFNYSPNIHSISTT